MDLYACHRMFVFCACLHISESAPWRDKCDFISVILCPVKPWWCVLMYTDIWCMHLREHAHLYVYNTYIACLNGKSFPIAARFAFWHAHQSTGTRQRRPELLSHFPTRNSPHYLWIGSAAYVHLTKHPRDEASVHLCYLNHYWPWQQAQSATSAVVRG